jgi:hypothetical protein
MFLSAAGPGGSRLKRAAKIRGFFDFQNSVENFLRFLVSFCQFNQLQLSQFCKLTIYWIATYLPVIPNAYSVWECKGSVIF